MPTTGSSRVAYLTIYHSALFERGGSLWYAISFAFGASALTVRRAACTVGRTADGIRFICSATVIIGPHVRDSTHGITAMSNGFQLL